MDPDLARVRVGNSEGDDTMHLHVLQPSVTPSNQHQLLHQTKVHTVMRTRGGGVGGIGLLRSEVDTV